MTVGFIILIGIGHLVLVAFLEEPKWDVNNAKECFETVR